MSGLEHQFSHTERISVGALTLRNYSRVVKRTGGVWCGSGEMLRRPVLILKGYKTLPVASELAYFHRQAQGGERYWVPGIRRED